jgi:tetraacyldisaccharide 4'-kinase
MIKYHDIIFIYLISKLNIKGNKKVNNKNEFFLWIEQYLFFPNQIQTFISFLLIPFSLIYCLIVTVKRMNAKPIDYEIPIISIGNLIVGGSGKTPFTIALAKNFDNCAIILRGYGRQSTGLFVVSYQGRVLENVKKSGDEAMLYATQLNKATVIVSEDRVEGINKAKELGAKVIFLDDGFSKINIKKFDILIRPRKEPTNLLCLPSGGYREPKSLYETANLVAKENTNFTRQCYISNQTEKMVLVTAISKPQRLNKFIDEDIKKFYFPDHYYFQKEELEEIIAQTNATSILVTRKDYVKLKNFNLPISILELDINIDKSVLKLVQRYVNVNS